jgi:hypothetical protein
MYQKADPEKQKAMRRALQAQFRDYTTDKVKKGFA